MSNILNKPYTNNNYANFTVMANGNGQRIEQDNKSIYALYPHETLENGKIIDLSQTPAYKEAQKLEREIWWNKNFFEVKTVGWIRKEFKMKDGRTKDFIFDAFPMMTALISNNQLPANSMIFYSLPDFTKELSEEYLKTLNSINQQLTVEQTIDFVNTCKLQLAQGFFGA